MSIYIDGRDCCQTGQFSQDVADGALTFRLPGVTFFCISDTLVPTTYLVDTTLSNSSDSDQTVQAVRLHINCSEQTTHCT
ncbi:hypothetical protein CGC46_28765 (plasmid) [Escherichia coli O121:H19]|nr:hypothetical protein CGC46_28765 [Escherichia coli O121:H19]AWJ30418.1 hypothetical protein I3S_28910 [Escherichia coli O121 str. RM8352]QCH75367.1 hypothetical protein B9X35_028865 [Escherichia coli O121:H19]